jgi:hypothetical protein
MEKEMLKKIFTNKYVVVGLLIFILFMAVALWFEMALGEALLASLALTLVALGAEVWREFFG